MAARKKKYKKLEKSVTEITKGRPRIEEEKFYVRFSGTQLNVVLLIILSATFLMQGVIRYFELIGETEFIQPWLRIVILALIFLVFSIVLISLGGIVAKLKFKRSINVVSFISFLIGFAFFLASLLFLIFSL